MSVAGALAFIHAARRNDELRARIAALSHDGKLDALSPLAPECEFSNEELYEAFRIDWTARWLHYRKE